MTNHNNLTSSQRSFNNNGNVMNLQQQESIRRSIGGRLGSGTLSQHMGSATLSQRLPAIQTEETSLLGKGEGSSPSLVVWILPALTCAAAYAFYNIFIKKGSNSIHPILGCVILQFVAALLGSALMGIIMLTKGVQSVIQYDAKGLKWAICAGLAVGTAEMLSFVVNGMGVDATQSIPVTIGGSVMFGAVLGMALLNEVLMLHGWIGVSMLIIGIGMVATDPGEHVTKGGGEGGNAAPPLVIWIGPALFCATCYALYNIFIKLGSASLNPILGGVILQFVAAIFGSILLALLSLYEGGTDYLNWDWTGLMWSCCAGVAVGTSEILSFVVSGLGVPATHSIPVIIGGSTFFGALLGLMILGETLELQGWSGVVLLTVGIGVVATDPGEKMEGH
mmetsp:Transcript_25590/g.38776  ORF Transcript_25590/g.38776 Transcript_25590/m.38776 type:complete len:392 (+) Transcript_25590:155-1330(+)